MSLQPINIRALVGAPAATVAGYGRKTAGVVELLRLRDSAPVRYDVPDGWAIPPRVHRSSLLRPIPVGTDGYGGHEECK